MRLIIFLKIPERVEPIPLDVIDDRPTQSVLGDILVLTNLSSEKDYAMEEYFLEKDGEKLDLDLSLSGNGVKNGDTLVLVKSNKKKKILDDQEIDNINVQPPHLEAPEKPTKNKNIEKKKSNVPGKKIDFD